METLWIKGILSGIKRLIKKWKIKFLIFSTQLGSWSKWFNRKINKSINPFLLSFFMILRDTWDNHWIVEVGRVLVDRVSYWAKSLKVLPQRSSFWMSRTPAFHSHTKLWIIKTKTKWLLIKISKKWYFQSSNRL